jgi:hypothetical protein
VDRLRGIGAGGAKGVQDAGSQIGAVAALQYLCHESVRGLHLELDRAPVHEEEFVLVVIVVPNGLVADGMDLAEERLEVPPGEAVGERPEAVGEDFTRSFSRHLRRHRPPEAHVALACELIRKAHFFREQGLRGDTQSARNEEKLPYVRNPLLVFELG